jgi:hypothetical protein
MSGCLLNAPVDRLLAVCHLLSHPPYIHPDIQCLVDRQGICLKHKSWGDLVRLEACGFQSSLTLLSYHFPEYPDQSETLAFELALTTRFTAKNAGNSRNLKMDLKTSPTMAWLSNELFQIRAECREQALSWFFEGLRIWGIAIPNQPERTSQPDHWLDRWWTKIGMVNSPKVAFHFFIDGSPADFAVMVQETFNDGVVGCSISTPSAGQKPRGIPADANPVCVQIYSENVSLDITAYKGSIQNTVLKISLPDNHLGWSLWDDFRNNLERLGWFSIPKFQNPREMLTPSDSLLFTNTPRADIRSEDRTEKNQNETSQAWQTIPDKGWDRECLQLWHRGLTCKQIGTRLQKNDKTIRNRLNQLRNEFGEQIVPYRNSNPRST